MSTQSAKSPTQEALPKEQEEETKQNPENPQEQSNEEAKDDTKVATSQPPSSAEKESSPSMTNLKQAVRLLLGEYGLLSAAYDKKEDIFPQETNIHSSKSVPTLKPTTLPLKKRSTQPMKIASSSAEKESSPSNPTMIPPQSKPGNQPLKITSSSGSVSSTPPQKESSPRKPTKIKIKWGNQPSSSASVSSTSPQKESSPSNPTMIPPQLKPRNQLSKITSSSFSVSSAPPLDSTTPPKRALNDTGKDEDESQGKEKKKKEEAHGDDTNDEKPKEEEPLEPQTVFKMPLSIREAEAIVLNGLVSYYVKNERYPFDSTNDMEDFIRNCVQLDVPASKIMQMLQVLRKKYDEMVMLDNVGVLDPRDQQAFDLAMQIWWEN